MNPSDNTSMPHRLKHRAVRYSSRFGAGLIPFFIVAFLLYVDATVSCLSGSESTFLCNLFRGAPWGVTLLAFGLYLGVLVAMHELGHAEYSNPGRVHWRNARNGYQLLQPGHHRQVRRLHQVAAVALAMVAAWTAFMFMETDTGATMITALVAWIVVTRLNWKTYPQLREAEYAAALEEDRKLTLAKQAKR